MSKNNLTIKEEKFCQEYVVNGGNASNAYRSSYDAKNMKLASINVAASRVLKKAKIRLRVKEIQTQVNKKYGVTIDRMTEKILRAMVDYEAPDDKDPTKVSNPQGLINAAMQAAKLNGLLNKTDQPISPTFVRMDNVTINGKALDWGVGEKPAQ